MTIPFVASLFLSCSLSCACPLWMQGPCLPLLLLLAQLQSPCNQKTREHTFPPFHESHNAAAAHHIGCHRHHPVLVSASKKNASFGGGCTNKVLTRSAAEPLCPPCDAALLFHLPECLCHPPPSCPCPTFLSAFAIFPRLSLAHLSERLCHLPPCVVGY